MSKVRNMQDERAMSVRTFPSIVKSERETYPDDNPPVIWWHNLLVRLGLIMATKNSSVETPRINPSIISLLALLLTACIAFGSAMFFVGKQVEKNEQLEKQREQDKKDQRIREEDFKQEIRDRLNGVGEETEPEPTPEPKPKTKKKGK